MRLRIRRSIGCGTPRIGGGRQDALRVAARPDVAEVDLATIVHSRHEGSIAPDRVAAFAVTVAAAGGIDLCRAHGVDAGAREAVLGARFAELWSAAVTRLERVAKAALHPFGAHARD